MNKQVLSVFSSVKAGMRVAYAKMYAEVTAGMKSPTILTGSLIQD